MDIAKRKRLKWLTSGISLVWVLVVGWMMWTTLPNDVAENHGSSSVKDRMANECTGSYKSRYECKEAIIIESSRDSFSTLALRFLVVIIPPLILTGWVSSYLSKRSTQIHLDGQGHHGGHHHTPGVHVPHHQPLHGAGASDDWKMRAKTHTQSYPDHGADHDNQGHDVPDQYSQSAPAAAPAADWKSKAQSNIRKPH